MYQRGEGHHKGGDRSEAHALRGQVGDDARHDGQDPVPECRHGECDPDPLRGEAVTLGVLVHVPRM